MHCNTWCDENDICCPVPGGHGGTEKGHVDGPACIIIVFNPERDKQKQSPDWEHRLVCTVTYLDLPLSPSLLFQKLYSLPFFFCSALGSPQFHRHRGSLVWHAPSAPAAPGHALRAGADPERRCPGVRAREEPAGRKHRLWLHPVAQGVPLLPALLLVHQGDPGLSEEGGKENALSGGFFSVFIPFDSPLWFLSSHLMYWYP